MSRPLPIAQGFTLLELSLVLAIGVVLMSASYLLSIGAIRAHEFRRTHEIVNRELWRARSDTLSNTKDSGWGVRFSANTLTRYRGSSYATRQSAEDIVHTLGGQLTFSTTTDVPFLRPEGTVSGPYVIVLTDQIRTATTTVHTSGAILTP